MHVGVCWGEIDAWRGIYIDGKPIWEGSQTFNTTLTIDKKSLFGGNKKEGGVAGQIYLNNSPGYGGPALPAGLASRLGLTSSTAPGFLYLANLFFVATVASGGGGFLWGSNQPYIKPISVKVNRVSRSLGNRPGYGGDTAIMADADTCNPIQMIHECLTNDDWGMGASPSAIDNDSFWAAAEAMKEEEFGLAMMWAEQSRIQDFIQEILDHISATLYVDPQTGKITIKLIRDDYDIDDLPILDASNCVIEQFQRKTWGETVNEIVVTWTNPENEEGQTVSQHDLANIQNQGGIVSDSRNYYGIRNGELAAQVATRDLRSAGYPLASFNLRVNRTVTGLVPGGVARLQFPGQPYGINDVVIRLTEVNYGKIGASTIKVTAAEDIFALTTAIYVTPPESEWEDTSVEPEDFTTVQALSLPYYFIASTLAQAGISGEPTYPEVLMGVLAAPDNADTASFDLHCLLPQPQGGTAYENVGTKILASHGELDTSLVEEATTVLSFSDVDMGTIGSGMVPQTPGFAIFGAGDDDEMEICLITSGGITSGSVTLQRGCLDTTPKEWPVGTPVWFIDFDGGWTEETIFSAAETVTYKTCPTTSLGTLDIADASARNRLMTDRLYRPLRPARVEMGGVYFGTYDHIGSGDITVNWANRNRLTEDSAVLSWMSGDVTPETGQTTTIDVYNSSNVLLISYTGLTGTTHNIPVSVFGMDTEGYIRVSSERDGFESLINHEIGITLTP